MKINKDIRNYVMNSNAKGSKRHAYNYFIDDEGGIFYSESLWKAAKDLPVFELDVDAEDMLGQKVYWSVDTFKEFAEHIVRLDEADLDVPIILRSDSVVMDGRHRVLKAILTGKKKIKAKIFKVDPLPDKTK